MPFQFDFHSNPISDPARIDALVQHWIDGKDSEFASRLHAAGVTTEIVADPLHGVHIAIVLNLEKHHQSFDARGFTEDLIARFRRMAECFELVWNVGHSLDSELGTVADGVDTKPLIDELCVAIRIAKSFSGSVPDDDVNGSLWQVVENESSRDLDWEELLMPQDRFVRFRELESFENGDSLIDRGSQEDGEQ